MEILILRISKLILLRMLCELVQELHFMNNISKLYDLMNKGNKERERIHILLYFNLGNMSLPHSIIANTAQGDLGIYYPEFESPEK